ncbi:hypothetical protein ACFQ2B_04785 [Streptomyces stramineus]
MSTLGHAPVRRWEPQVFTPFAESPGVVFARTAARSAEFGTAGVSGAHGAGDVIVGSGAGATVPTWPGGPGASCWSGWATSWPDGRPRAPPGGRAPTRTGGGAACPPSTRPRSPAPPATVRGAACGCHRSLLTGDELLVPAGAVYLRHRPPAGRAAWIKAGSTGLGAHPDRREAATTRPGRSSNAT